MDALLTAAEAAERIHATRRTIDNWTARGLLRAQAYQVVPDSRGARRRQALYLLSDVLAVEARTRTSGKAWDRTRRAVSGTDGDERPSGE